SVNQFNLSVEDPSHAFQGDFSGSTGNMPQHVYIDNPVAGSWKADVQGYLVASDTYHLVVTSDVPTPANPVPTISAGGPYRFNDGAVQTLAATVTGGTAPRNTAWDLDGDGTFDIVANSVTTHFPV